VEIMATEAMSGEPRGRMSWVLLSAGLVSTSAACVAARFPEASAPRAVLVGVGLLATAGALTIQRPTVRMLLAAALVPFLAGAALDVTWDTARLMLWLLAAVAVAGAGLLALPARWRRLAVSLLVALHFGGIATAVVSLPPPGGDESWLASQLHTRFYRPYLEFMVLTNAYHFYAPEPGPETLVWFHLTFADGTTRWVKLPDTSEERANLSDLRLGGLAQGIMDTVEEDEVPEELIEQRVEAGERFDPPLPEPEEDLTEQYQEPTAEAKRTLACYARHVAKSYGEEGNVVSGIKIYRVVHRLLTPEEFAAGMDPADPTTYLAYYQGDFNANGKLKRSCYWVTRSRNGEVTVHQDPLLYWLLQPVREEDGSVIDYIQLHAESDKQD
jgi:hypothetical protein